MKMLLQLKSWEKLNIVCSIFITRRTVLAGEEDMLMELLEKALAAGGEAIEIEHKTESTGSPSCDTTRVVASG